MHAFSEIEKEYLRTDLPAFRPGDTVRVNVRVREGDKQRIQAFEGVCIARKHGGISETFKVRKISNGVGVERTFPLHSPVLESIEMVRQGRVRRAKLYYLRALRGKAARLKERRTREGAPVSAPRLSRLRNPLRFEQGLRGRIDGTRVAGVDEAGRGPLAGPVVAAAVVMPPGIAVPGVDDSKKLSAERREALEERIRSAALAVGVGAASAREIDRLNVRAATALAMQRAVAALPFAPDHLLVDGLPVPELGTERQTAVVRGDSLVHSIACASIIAKTVRDRLMHRLALRHPGYGWERNMGYGTDAHRAALRELGPTPHHRLSFAPVQLCLLSTRTA